MATNQAEKASGEIRPAILPHPEKNKKRIVTRHVDACVCLCCTWTWRKQRGCLCPIIHSYPACVRMCVCTLVLIHKERFSHHEQSALTSVDNTISSSQPVSILLLINHYVQVVSSIIAETTSTNDGKEKNTKWTVSLQKSIGPEWDVISAV